MKKLLTLSILSCLVLTSYGPGNCNLYEGNCKAACKKAEEAIRYRQGSRECQERFDEAIEMCPSFDYPYYEKAVPYAKRGDIKVWKELIDKAVEIDPIEHLANRGWYHWFFLNNYEAAIIDIEKLDSLNPYDIGSTGDAVYHLNIMKAFCYYEIDQKKKALEIIELQIADSNHYMNMYDNICLGVMRMELGETEKATEAFKAQAEENDIAENHYYLAKIYFEQNNLAKALEELEIAHKYYNSNRTMENGYRELPFEIYQIDIDELRNKVEG